MLKEILLIAFVFGAGFLFLIPGSTQSPSTVSVLKKNVTAMENFEIHGNLTVMPKESDYALLISKDTATDMCMISTNTSGLYLNPFSGNVTIGAVGKPACIQIRDSNDGNWTKCTTLAGVMICSVGAC